MKRMVMEKTMLGNNHWQRIFTERIGPWRKETIGFKVHLPLDAGMNTRGHKVS